MKNKVLFIGNIVAILSCLSFSACSNQAPAEKDIAEKTSSTAETTQSVSTESGDESSVADMHSERFYEFKEMADGEKITYNEKTDSVIVGFERTGDNEITSYDGNIIRRFEYEIDKEENTLIFHVTTVNNFKEMIELDCRPFYKVYTDLSDRDMGFAIESIFRGTKIPAESSVTEDYTHDLENGWSEAEISMSLGVCSVDSDDIKYADMQEAGKFELTLSTSETDSEKNALDKYAYKVEYSQIGKKNIYIGVERVSDNEVKTKDGRLSRKFEYAVNEETNSIDFTVTSTNHSDEDIVIEKRAWIVVRTDLTDPDINFSQTSDFQGVRIKPGESVEYNTSWELEDGWSTADVEMGLYVQVDEEGVWYGGEPDGDSMDFDFTVTA